MDDVSSKLSEILNDPQSMERVRQMAETLFANGQEPAASTTDTAPKSESASAPAADALTGLLGEVDIGSVTALLSRLKNTDDERVRLIMALRPHLSEKRRERADNAIKILKLIDLLPLLKDSGLLHW